MAVAIATATAATGSITKTGSGHARCLLVEAAWHYRRSPSVGLTLERGQREAPVAAIEVA